MDDIGFIIAPSTDDPDGIEYVPDIGDNRDRAPAAQFTVTLKPLTGAEYRKIEEANLLGKSDKFKDPLAAVSRRMEAIKRQVLKSHVTALKNFFVRDKAMGQREIKTINELIDLLDKAAPSQRFILDDIFNALVDNSALEDGLIPEFDALPSS